MHQFRCIIKLIKWLLFGNFILKVCPAALLTFEAKFLSLLVYYHYIYFIFGVSFSQRRSAETVVRIGHKNKQWREARTLLNSSYRTIKLNIIVSTVSGFGAAWKLWWSIKWWNNFLFHLAAVFQINNINFICWTRTLKATHCNKVFQTHICEGFCAHLIMRSHFPVNFCILNFLNKVVSFFFFKKDIFLEHFKAHVSTSCSNLNSDPICCEN